MINTGKTWYSPLAVFEYIYEFNRQDHSKVSSKLRQKVEESRIGAVVALLMYGLRGEQAHIQLYEPDPPDVLVHMYSKTIKGQSWISMVEITTYLGQPIKSLLEQLQNTKVPENYDILDEHYVLVVHLGVGMEIDPVPVRNYLNKKAVRFPVWIVQDRLHPTDTTAGLTIVNPEISQSIVNIGKLAFDYKTNRYPWIFERNRVGNPDLVRFEPNDKEFPPPWEMIGR